jgi:hypothetical protein
MEKTKVICDVCKKEIKEGYERRYMIALIIYYPFQYNDGGSCPAVDRESKTYHLHFDCSKKMFKACPEIFPESLG